MTKSSPKVVSIIKTKQTVVEGHIQFLHTPLTTIYSEKDIEWRMKSYYSEQTLSYVSCCEAVLPRRGAVRMQMGRLVFEDYPYKFQYTPGEGGCPATENV